MSLEMVPAKVGGKSGACNEPRATGQEQSTQASTATLRVATTQRPPKGAWKAKGLRTEMTWNLRHHPNSHRHPPPAQDATLYDSYPRTVQLIMK